MRGRRLAPYPTDKMSPNQNLNPFPGPGKAASTRPGITDRQIVITFLISELDSASIEISTEVINVRTISINFVPSELIGINAVSR
jgi:hypothetical protein